METPIIVLVKEIQVQSQIALDHFKLMNDSKGKTRTTANDTYVDAVRQINILSHAIEKLNQA